MLPPVLHTGVTPTRWAEDANTLVALIRSSFAAKGLKAPPLIGPDHCETTDALR